MDNFGELKPIDRGERNLQDLDTSEEIQIRKELWDLDFELCTIESDIFELLKSYTPELRPYELVLNRNALNPHLVADTAYRFIHFYPYRQTDGRDKYDRAHRDLKENIGPVLILQKKKFLPRIFSRRNATEDESMSNFLRILILDNAPYKVGEPGVPNSELKFKSLVMNFRGAPGQINLADFLKHPDFKSTTGLFPTYLWDNSNHKHPNTMRYRLQGHSQYPDETDEYYSGEYEHEGYRYSFLGKEFAWAISDEFFDVNLTRLWAGDPNAANILEVASAVQQYKNTIGIYNDAFHKMRR